MNTEIKFTRINNDVNGNPRYVCHFLNLVNDSDRDKAMKLSNNGFYLSELYNVAIMKSRSIGGKKFSNKQYGGGIVFGSVYNIRDLEKRVNEIKFK